MTLPWKPRYQNNGVGWRPLLLCNGNSSYYSYSSSTHFCPLDFSEMPWSNFIKPCRNIIWQLKLCFCYYTQVSYTGSWEPLVCFHGNCGKVCPTDSDFLGLSRSTRCGYCSYQVSPISVQRVTCYDHFCVFQFFSILAVSMATATILKKSTLKSTTSHGIWYSYKVL
jgi:hypothetical protein